ncbi:MAG: tRNA glutamyl-Q(34) synthetase GluQRS [Immundisolibacteraceae bacterium]|nr:tRNA glutamyl-Q(34) synthetase GluQRS [Immundisolibacteraceae bacterium]
MTEPYADQTCHRGRFAPSPTGPLHLGSLVAALGSYLNIRRTAGVWLVRIDDIDQPRSVPGIDQQIIDTLALHGLESDEPVRYSSQRLNDYEAAYASLEKLDHLFPCCCSRRQVRHSQTGIGDTLIYNGNCRNGILSTSVIRSYRVRVPDAPITFKDHLQGIQTDSLSASVGDFVVRRVDGQFAYQLATVVDDQLQQITEVVRGNDLLPSTGRQILLQRLLGYHQPEYFHLPVVTNQQFEKLSKQQGAPPIDGSRASDNLVLALELLKQSPPPILALENPSTILKWAIKHWHSGAITMTPLVTLTTES